MREVSDQYEKLWKGYIEYAFKNIQVFITGVAGFIGSYVNKALLEKGFSVVGLDNLNDYYNTKLKEARLLLLEQ